MHWFDRASQELAETPSSTTRRTVLQGAAFVALAAPFGKTAVTYAANQIRRSEISAECLACLIGQSSNYNQALAECKKTGHSITAVPELFKPKGGGKPGRPKSPGKGGKKKTKGAKPTKAAQEAACIAKAVDGFLNHGVNACRIAQCSQGTSPEPGPPGLEEGHSAKCAPGTMPCAEGLCCYGGDKCCRCSGNSGPSFTCCAAVIDCECCG